VVKNKNMQAIKQKLESAFRRIEQERMRDIPVCNPALQVEAVGFREWGKYYLGVVITPWFMNLMLLPVCAEDFQSLKEGSKKLHIFPSGRYEFIVGREADLGGYQVCSLFSPMHDFVDQQTAVDTATLVLAELMDDRNQDTVSLKAESLKIEPQSTESQRPGQKQTWDTPISRRNFLLGGGRSRTGEPRGGD
jgi:[NiFe] hydrogenase assembly HybE family chaperone